MAGIDIRLPNITAGTEAGQLAQIRSYLYQLAQQLQWAIGTIDAGSTGGRDDTAVSSPASGSGEQQALTTFNSVKALIIKSADIVNAYYDKINKRLEGMYVAKSDFGTYTEATSQGITENSTAIERLFQNIQTISAEMIDVNAHIKSGLLYYAEDGSPVYGLEIGQRTEIDGVEVFNKYARFTSEKLAFYDSNDNEVAYISDRKLYITHVEVTGSFTTGGLVDTVLPDRSVVTRYIEDYGGEG